MPVGSSLLASVRGAPSPLLLARGTMTFARASRAAWHSGAASSAYAVDVARLVGGGYAIENATTNVLGAGSRDFAHANWNNTPSGLTLTAGALDGPDGASLTADRLEVTSSGYGPARVEAGAGYLSASVWARALSGSGSAQIFVGYTNYLSQRWSLTTAWQRLTLSSTVSEPSTRAASIADARGLGGGTTAAIDCVLDLATVTAGPYVTTDVLDGARTEDVMTWDPAEVPLQLREGISIHRIHPFYSSAELARVGTCSRTLISFGSADDRLELAYTGSDCRVRVYAGGSAVVTSSAVTWAADRDATGTPLSITCDPVGGEIMLSGFSTGDGTHAGSSWAWPGGEIVRLGGSVGASGDSADGVVYIPRRA